jgi:hypothetical protein
MGRMDGGREIAFRFTLFCEHVSKERGWQLEAERPGSRCVNRASASAASARCRSTAQGSPRQIAGADGRESDRPCPASAAARPLAAQLTGQPDRIIVCLSLPACQVLVTGESASGTDICIEVAGGGKSVCPATSGVGVPFR